jgi:hypothetical protein
VPKDRKIIIKALCLGREREVRSEDDSSPLIQNIPPHIPLPRHGIFLYYTMALALLLTANNHPEVALPLITILGVQHLLEEFKAFILTFDQ